MAPLGDIPQCAWKRRFDEKAPKKGSPVRPTLPLLVQMAPALGRIIGQAVQDWRAGRKSVLVGIPPRISPTMGVPLGGLGGGSITRGWRGNFVRWQLRPGIYRYGVVPMDQFSLWVRREGRDAGPAEKPQALVLSPRPARLGEGLGTWNWDLDEAKTTYHALYPRAWTVYEEPVPGIRLVCRQISPFIPRNYKESSYPVGVFVWTVENTGATGADVAIMFTFQNGDGGPNDLAGGHVNRAVEEPGGVVGVELRHAYRDPLSFAIAARSGAGVDVTRRTSFVSSVAGRATGGGTDLPQIWRDFEADGRLYDQRTGLDGRPPENGRVPDDSGLPSGKGWAKGAALASKVRVPAGQSRELVFSLAWDMPVARFGSGSAWYRRYTRFYGRDGGAAMAIARDALLSYPAWEEEIAAWQKPTLDDPALPDWYKAMLFNELYYLVDGGTIWTDGEAPAGPGAPADSGAGVSPIPEPEIGHFAYLEGHEYLMYNTYDVHFTASFALAELWPELELGLQRDVANAVRLEDPQPVTFILSGRRGQRKVRGAVPHDLGSPVEDPWRRINAYNAQDSSRWKDLNPKFVLQVYRDWVLTQDRSFLGEVWEAVEEAMAFTLRFDRDGDGLIENDGFPDQTYDVWSARGPSAYSGGLWLASLAAAAAMAEEMGRAERAGEYRALLARAQAAYEGRLWNGSYYDYDASQSRHHDSVMADQMCGPWFALACGLPPVVPEEHLRSALRKVFELNVMGWRPRERGASVNRTGTPSGERGAVNGMRPDGRVDGSCLQSQEVWIGTTFTLAAAMLRAGLAEEAFTTARGIDLSTYRDFGLWFQTPEGISVNGIYRSAAYMRPLAVWGMHKQAREPEGSRRT